MKHDLNECNECRVLERCYELDASHCQHGHELLLPEKKSFKNINIWRAGKIKQSKVDLIKSTCAELLGLKAVVQPALVDSRCARDIKNKRLIVRKLYLQAKSRHSNSLLTIVLTSESMFNPNSAWPDAEWLGYSMADLAMTGAYYPYLIINTSICDKDELKKVLAHEIGHAFGCLHHNPDEEHVRDESCVMNTYNDEWEFDHKRVLLGYCQECCIIINKNASK